MCLTKCSLNEQCSFSILEMMKHGLPVIVYDLSGMSCLIKHNVNGTKVKVKKGVKITLQRLQMIENLADSIIKYLKNPSAIENEGKQAREYFEKNFSREVFSTKMNKFYTELLLN